MSMGRTAVRPYTPLPPRGRGAGSEGDKKCAYPARSEPKWRTLVIPIARTEFTIAPLLQVPPASRGEPNLAPAQFPMRAGGTLRRGVFNLACFRKFCLRDRYQSLDTPPQSML